MTAIHVCPLTQVSTVIAASGAEWSISLLALTQRLPDLSALRPERRLHLALSDIVHARDGYVLTEEEHILQLLAFVSKWDRQAPLLIHCYAGVSRSTAAAFVALCALNPETPEADHARRLRLASPTATPNPRIVALADAILGRGHRMIEAIKAIGRGADCFEGAPFSLSVEISAERETALDAARAQLA